mgnify:CR=1 FL=1
MIGISLSSVVNLLYNLNIYIYKMSNTYPNEKIEELNSYMKNFLNDIVYMKDVIEKMKDWDKRGVFVGNSVETLEEQIEEWENKKDSLIEEFKNNILKLKEMDDRIDNDNNIIFSEPNGSYEDKWEYLYTIYYDLFHNLYSDISILNNVSSDINKYEKLGVKLGNVNSTIYEQTENIKNAINDSLDELNKMIDNVKDYSQKILSEEELVEKRNEYLALYSKIGVDAMTFLLYFNANTQINWDPVVDGGNVLKHVKKALLSTHSPIYNESIGNAHYETGATKLYNWIYFGFDKDNMIKAGILNDTYGASYQDEHGYQRLINTFYDRSSDNVQKMVDLFKSKDLVYNPGSQTTEKLYIVYSVEEITDFSKLTFRGEN